MREVLTGEHFMLGDHACAEGALAAGCRFFAGYPITPSTEIAERLAARLPEVGGVFIQMEDELASIAAVIGASCGGGTELEFVIMVIAVSCVKLLSAHNSTQHTSRKHKV
jgi:2-oxoglutarate ferredoxin oxidoreductase, alpha subunit (EC 1.2.7.3)